MIREAREHILYSDQQMENSFGKYAKQITPQFSVIIKHLNGPCLFANELVVE